MKKKVLNLIINGLPSKLRNVYNGVRNVGSEVLNLIINGLPSKQKAKKVPYKS